MKSLHTIGFLGQSHALKGEINLSLDFPVNLSSGDFLFVDIDNTFIPYQIESIRERNAVELSYIVKFYDIESAEDTSILKNKVVLTEELPELDDDDESLYARDLIGFEVIDNTDNIIGEIIDFDDSTLNSLLIIENKAGKEIYIPFVEEYIEEFDPEERILKVSLPEGFDC